jgi:dTDP-glucose 4,6-dehydratase
MEKRRVIVSGGAGFIGSNLVRCLLASDFEKVMVLNKTTYCGHPTNLADVADHGGLEFVSGDIGDRQMVSALIERFRPSVFINCAGETHVDRSILWPDEFVNTNIIGFHNLLAALRASYSSSGSPLQRDFCFVHVSTDEVYGPLGESAPRTVEGAPYRPSSPYAASKGAADLLLRAYQRTYGLPGVIVHLSNVYGPRQHPEKLIPATIMNCLMERPIPIYGDGHARRDWTHINDICDALMRLLTGSPAEDTYHISSGVDADTLRIVELVCDILDRRAPRSHGSYRDLMRHVKDRPGHDRRYGLDCGRIKREMGWAPAISLEAGMEKTVEWYLENRAWLAHRGSDDGAYPGWLSGSELAEAARDSRNGRNL